jgi:integrase
MELIKREFSSENAKIIKKYDTEMINQTLAKATRWKHLQTIINLTKMIKKDWTKVTKEDIDELVAEIIERFGSTNGQESNYSYDHKKILKIFFRWLKLGSREFKEVGDPPETKGVRLRSVKDTLIREDLLTEEDFQKLLNACGENQRDRTLFFVHYEAGTRPSELLSLKIKHVKFDKVGANIHVFGKTGARTIRLIKSVPDLARWINVHPNKTNLRILE